MSFNIKAMRKAAGLTQMDLAEKIGVGQPTIAMWENGVAMPTSSRLPHIAEVLGCSIDDLFDESERSVTG